LRLRGALARRPGHRPGGDPAGPRRLWLGGPANAAKDGIAPLGGIIETDWSPYTFTMNWRFTRANHWVRFEQDEAICLFFPVQRGLLQQIAPELRPIEREPGLLEAFQQWSASRSAFQEHVQRTNPAAPADKWQKLYYRGLCPNNAQGPGDHEPLTHLPSSSPAVSTSPCVTSA